MYRLTKVGVLATILIVLAGSAAQLINYGFFDQRIQALDSRSDGGVFGAIGDIALAAAAVSAWLVAARVRSERSVAGVLAGLLTFLAVDKAVRLHDHIPHWLAVYLPVLFGSFVCLVAVARDIPGRPRRRVDRGVGRVVVDRLIGVGLLLLIFSFLLHLFGERLLLVLGVSNTTGLAYQVKAVVKHGTEVAGWLLIALGLLRFGLLSRHDPDAVAPTGVLR
jgi:phage shock protein PspC (stress-responsive transcriptional regulator)